MKSPHPNDAIVGTNIRIHRIHARVSQTDLGKKLGVTFQQVQKYEKGTNRVGAGRLHIIAGILKVPVSAFFEGIKASPNAHTPILLLNRPDAIKLAEAFDKIEDADLRHSIVALVQALAKR
jgi:transcriptional regulator with XRE-family HTH domain